MFELLQFDVQIWFSDSFQLILSLVIHENLILAEIPYYGGLVIRNEKMKRHMSESNLFIFLINIEFRIFFVN